MRKCAVRMCDAMIIEFPHLKLREDEVRKRIYDALEYLSCKGRIIEQIPRESIASEIYRELSRKKTKGSR